MKYSAAQVAAAVQSCEAWAALPDSLVAMIEHLRPALNKAGVSNADDVAVVVVMELCGLVGGGQIYWPNAESVHRSIRNTEIVAAHRAGRPVSEIGRKYDVCDRVVWEIVAAHNAALAQKQTDLFLATDG